MAVGPGGSIGAAGSKTVAATRIDVVDPHIAQMMRDVMSDTDTVPRLNPGGAGGRGAHFRRRPGRSRPHHPPRPGPGHGGNRSCRHRAQRRTK